MFMYRIEQEHVRARRNIEEIRRPTKEKTVETGNCCIIEDDTEEKPLRMRNSELLQTLETEERTFKVNDISHMPEKVNYCVDSQTFPFDGTTFHIRIYNKKLDTNGHSEWISFIVRRIGVHPSKQNVLFTFGIRDKVGEVKHTVEQIYKKNDLESEIIKLLPLSEALSENDFVQEDSIEIYCKMSVSRIGTETEETSESTFSAPGETFGLLIGKMKTTIVQEDIWQLPLSSPDTQTVRSSESQCSTHSGQQMEVLASSRTKRTCIQNVEWELPCHREMSSKLGCYMVSPEFKLEGKIYRMRFYPRGRSDYECFPGVLVMLERSTSPSQSQRVTCEIGIKKTADSVDSHSEKHCLNEHEDVLGPIKLISNVEMEYSLDLPITVFCNMSTKKITTVEPSKQTEVSN